MATHHLPSWLGTMKPPGRMETPQDPVEADPSSSTPDRRPSGMGADRGELIPPRFRGFVAPSALLAIAAVFFALLRGALLSCVVGFTFNSNASVSASSCLTLEVVAALLFLAIIVAVVLILHRVLG
jgi:hypothetical protein